MEYLKELNPLFQHEIPERGRKTYRPKRCLYNNESNSPNILSDKKAIIVEKQ